MFERLTAALLRILDFVNRRLVFPWRERRVVEALAPWVPAGARLLDFGCGDGHLTRSLSLRTGAEITGIDIHAPPAGVVPAIVYDGKNLPLRDGSFDGVVMVDMLHHTRDVREVLAGLARVSRGYLLIKDMKYRSRFGYRVLQFTDLWTNKPDPRALLRYNYLTWDEWQTIFAALGLVVVRVKPSFSLIPLDPIRHLNFIALLEKPGAVPDGRAGAAAGAKSGLRARPAGLVTEREVVAANRALFERHVGPFQELHQQVLEGEGPYLEKTLARLRSRVDEGPVLDAGCGDGRITARARRVFREVVGVDLSLPLLRELPRGSRRVCGDLGRFPFRDGAFSLVLCQYTLHHLYSIEGFVREASRVLRPGGILYIDHEMDAAFMGRFRWLVWLHDFFFGLDKRYRKADPAIRAEQIRTAEFHYYQSRGISTGLLRRELEKAGFTEIEIRHHGFGISRFSNRLLAYLRLWDTPSFLSPHFSVTARKQRRRVE